MTFSKGNFIDEEFWNSVNGREFRRIKGKSDVLRAIECFARAVLLQDPFEPVLSSYDKCDGTKLE